MKKIHIIPVFLILLVCFGKGFPQQTERERGIELFDKGNFSEASESLKKAILQNSEDIIAFYYLALVLETQQLTSEAIKSYEQSINECLKLIEKIAIESLDSSAGKNKIKNYVKENWKKR